MVFFSAGAFAFVLPSVVVVCARSLPFAFACLLPCALALVCIVCCRAVMSQSYLWVFHAMSQVVIVNKQMAHSQIVVVITFSLSFEMDVALVLHRRPLGNVCFHCRLSIAVAIICLGMLSFAFDRFDIVVFCC